MTSKKLIFGITTVLLIGYLVALFYELKLQDTSTDIFLSQNELNTGKRYISLREIDPYFQLELGKDDSYNFSADDNGFIEPSGIHKNADVTIVFLGGSTTECFSVKEKMRFPYLVGQLLEKKTNLKLNTYNGARAGNNSVHTYMKFLNIVVPMKPQYAVIMHNINDLVSFVFTDSYWSNKNKNRFLVASFDSISSFEQSLTAQNVKQSFFPYTIKSIKKIKSSLIQKPNQSINNEWNLIDENQVNFDTTKLYDNFRSSINSFVSTSKAWGIEPILMTQFNRITMDIEEEFSAAWISRQLLKSGLDLNAFIVVYNRMNDIIREIATENHLTLIDLDRGIPKDKEFMSDHVHLTNKGSQRVAEVVSESLYSKINSTLQK